MYLRQTDYGAAPYIANIECKAIENENFRSAIWTGCHVQMTLMCIPSWGEIGVEMHDDTDQLIRIEQGQAMVEMGKQKCKFEIQERLSKGDVVFVPAGTWHNITNTGRSPLKLSSIYAPSNHPKGTIHRTKADAEREEHWEHQ